MIPADNHYMELERSPNGVRDWGEHTTPHILQEVIRLLGENQQSDEPQRLTVWQPTEQGRDMSPRLIVSNWSHTMDHGGAFRSPEMNYDDKAAMAWDHFKSSPRDSVVVFLTHVLLQSSTVEEASKFYAMLKIIDVRPETHVVQTTGVHFTYANGESVVDLTEYRAIYRRVLGLLSDRGKISG